MRRLLAVFKQEPNQLIALIGSGWVELASWLQECALPQRRKVIGDQSLEGLGREAEPIRHGAEATTLACEHRGDDPVIGVTGGMGEKPLPPVLDA